MKKNISFLIVISIVLIIFISCTPDKESKSDIATSGNYYSEQRNLKIINEMENKTVLNDFDYITLYHNKKDFDAEKESVVDWIKKGNVESYNILGKTRGYSLDIIMFGSTKEFKNSISKYLNSSIMGAAMYSGQAMFMNLKNVTPAIFIHEYLHFKTHSFCKDNDVDFLNLPIWFIEGIADYSVRGHGRHYNGESLDEVLSFKDMDNFSDIGDEKFYLQSYEAINKIIEIAGEKAIQDIIIKTKELEFYDAFENVVGINIEELEIELSKQIKDYKDSKVNNNDSNSKISELEKYVAEYPNDIKALKKLASLYYRNNNFEIAESKYLDYLEKVPDDDIAIHQLALVYEKQFKINEAIPLRETLKQQEESFVNLDLLVIDYLFTNPQKAVETSDMLVELSRKEEHEVEHYMNKRQVIYEYYKSMENEEILKAYYDLLNSGIFIIKDNEELVSSLIYDNIKDLKNSDELYDKIIDKIDEIENKYK